MFVCVWWWWEEHMGKEMGRRIGSWEGELLLGRVLLPTKAAVAPPAREGARAPSQSPLACAWWEEHGPRRWRREPAACEGFSGIRLGLPAKAAVALLMPEGVQASSTSIEYKHRVQSSELPVRLTPESEIQPPRATPQRRADPRFISSAWAC